MVSRKIKVGKKYLLGVRLKLPGSNLVVLNSRKGYVMCGYLNLAVANKFKDIAVKITGVSTIKEALKAKVYSAAYRAHKLGIHKNQPLKDVLKIIA